MSPTRSKPAPNDPKCPMCGAPSHQRYQPFCSRGCANRDLINWLGGNYRIPLAEAPGEQEDRDSED